MHNFKYSLKILFGNKMLIFWTFMFPLILGTFFKLAFNNIEKSEMLDIINIAFVQNSENLNNEIYKESFERLSDKNDKNRYFNLKYTDKEKADELLKENEISGYVMVTEDNIKVVVSKSDINQTVIKQVTEEINQIVSVTSNIPNTLEGKEKFLSNINKYFMENNYRSNIEDVSKNNLSYTMIEYYTLIAMAALYGGILGMYAINKVLPNMSNNGKRVAVSRASKKSLIFSSAVSSYVIQILGLAILFLYTIFVLKVDYGDNLIPVIIISLLGAFAGLSFGILVSSVVKSGEASKVGIMIGFSMLGSFFSGMMGITMKYIIDKNVPIINLINPVNMITDGLYAIYYYGLSGRFYFNVISLILFSLISLFISYLSLRRQKYDYI